MRLTIPRRTLLAILLVVPLAPFAAAEDTPLYLAVDLRDPDDLENRDPWVGWGNHGDLYVDGEGRVWAETNGAAGLQHETYWGGASCWCWAPADALVFDPRLEVYNATAAVRDNVNRLPTVDACREHPNDSLHFCIHVAPSGGTGPLAYPVVSGQGRNECILSPACVPVLDGGSAKFENGEIATTGVERNGYVALVRNCPLTSCRVNLP